MRKRRQTQVVFALAYDKRGRLLSSGRNSYVKTHPIQAQLAAYVGFPCKVFIHAEVDAIIKARGKKIHTLVITRINKHGEAMAAAPCPVCAEAIKRAGVKHVNHT